ncbi:MAG: hypothetical protein J5526_07120 [Bacteroidales bacterium]|nr:hypothetical protein [Bacteroidales bacterium]
MENTIPITGRIAIVDDVANQALPLMQVLSKNNIPYTFYDGNDSESFPEKPENDIRILFLDLNLLGNKVQNPKEIRSSLINTLRHLLSPENYPYVLILWSRQEHEYKYVVEDIFKNELKDRAPISIMPYVKSDFFPNFADEIDNTIDKQRILDELKKILAEVPAYSYLLQWENHIHNSADASIREIFHSCQAQDNWSDNANYILESFAHSYLEQHYKEASLEERAKASLLFLNDVFYDTLEANVVNSTIENVTELQIINPENKSDVRTKINYSLLMSKVNTSINQPGCVFTSTDSNVECIKCSNTLLNDCLKTEDIRDQVKEQFQDISKKEAKQYYGTLLQERRSAIKTTMLPCGVVVTPACDYAQNKAKYDRVVQGVIIDSHYEQFIDKKSEAIYVSPSFNDGSQERILVLNYRYFITQLLDKESNLNPLFRLRNSILSEIQSKLARHINRQGIMNL